MIGAVTSAAVAVKPPRVAREHLVYVTEQILVGTGSRLHERYPCSAVGYEYRDEPIALSPHEGRNAVGDVKRASGCTRTNPERLSVHRG